MGRKHLKTHNIHLNCAFAQVENIPTQAKNSHDKVKYRE